MDEAKEKVFGRRLSCRDSLVIDNASYTNLLIQIMSNDAATRR